MAAREAPPEGHWAIYGASRTGKSWKAKRWATALLRKGQPVFVLTAKPEADWPKGARLTLSPSVMEKWLSDAEMIRNAFVFVDEAHRFMKIGQQLSNPQKHPRLWSFTRDMRHDGVTGVFITHNPTDIFHELRGSLANFISFRLNRREAAERIVADAGQPRSLAQEIISLPKLHYVELTENDGVKYRRMT